MNTTTNNDYYTQAHARPVIQIAACDPPAEPKLSLRQAIFIWTLLIGGSWFLIFLFVRAV
jgi:hypothetical protein